MLELKKIEIENTKNLPFTALLYCAPGIGKSTAIGLIAEKMGGKTLVLDVDRTIDRTLAKGEIVKDTSKLLTAKIDNVSTFASWSTTLKEITESGILQKEGITTVAVDNISELERCILSDLGQQGKNKGVPSQGDYQTMQFKLVNSLRLMKSWGVNIIWTAWEATSEVVYPDGSKYSVLMPKMSAKIVDNICGLCDVVGKIAVGKEGKHGILLAATQNVYAKNQIDGRKFCMVEEFPDFTN